MAEQRQMEVAHSKKMFTSGGGNRKASSTFSSRLDAGRSGGRRGADLTLTAAELMAMNSQSLLLASVDHLDQLPMPAGQELGATCCLALPLPLWRCS